MAERPLPASIPSVTTGGFEEIRLYLSIIRDPVRLYDSDSVPGRSFGWMLRGIARRVIDMVQVSNNAAPIFGVLSLTKFLSISSESLLV